ncbi:MAG: DUF4065 domain-containing protein [Candidatus Omnitrophica bacterium]|nr:DUF4065 domain-containing protein [Candidatus Omnitrophota bacterium]
MFVIKSEDQYRKTVKRIEGLKEQIERVRQEHGSEAAEAFQANVADHLQALIEQVREYECLKKEGLGAFHPRALSEVGQYLIRARVAGGITQTELAKQLGVSQPMVYKYEVAEYQGVGLDILSKVARALKVTLDIEAASKSVVYQAARQEAAILYFLQQINNTFLGKTKLMKLLYYADYEWIQKKGRSLTGDVYIALQYGPVPKRATDTLHRLKERGIIRIEKTKLGDHDQERYLLLKEPDFSVFTREEIDHLAEIAQRFAHWSATQMTNLSHEEFPWQSTKLKEEILFFRAG